MIKYFTKLGLLFYSLLLVSCQPKNVDLANYVNPMIGTGFHGHTFPGPVVPFGRVQLSPDTKLNGWDASSGYHYRDTTIYGFSHTHLSGTGIGDMGDILFLPYTGNLVGDNPYASFDKSTEHAELGKYAVTLNPWNIKCELAATARTGWHKYSYPQNKDAKLVIDLAHILQYTWGGRTEQGEIKIIDDKTIEGYRLSSGWAKVDPIYFRAEFNQPFSLENILVDGKKVKTADAKGTMVKAFINFGQLNKDLVAKVSISSVDYQGAQKNMDEISSLNSFDEVVALSKKMWSERLASIQIETTDLEVKNNFYTALYHSQIAPMIQSDADGRYFGMDHKIHKMEKGNAYTVYSLWDTFRAWYPLMTLINKNEAVEWLYSLYSKYEQGGMLLKWGLNSNYTGTMVGYPAVALFADAATKGLVTKDLDKFTQACVKAATWQPQWLETSFHKSANRVMTKPIYYKEKYGFVPADSANKSVSYGLEMAYYDFCVSQIARLAGNDAIADEFQAKSNYYKNYYDATTGYMRAKNFDKTWIKNFHPKYSAHEHAPYVEGNAYQWTPVVPHDVEGLVELKGGKEQMGIWLDSLFTTSSEILGENASADITGLIGQYAHGNEPSHHVAYMYHYTDRAYRTNEVLDHILYEFYSNTPEGIIGNEDCGQMSAWYVLNAIGFYQIAPGIPTYHIGRPLVDKAKIKVDDGYFTIEVKNNSKKNKYVKSAFINGEKITDGSFRHSEIRAGGKLSITMSSEK